jgi:hypothetical protein
MWPFNEVLRTALGEFARKCLKQAATRLLPAGRRRFTLNFVPQPQGD